MFSRKRTPVKSEWSWDAVDANRPRRERQHQNRLRMEASEPATTDLGKSIEAVYADCSVTRLYSAVAQP